MYSTVSYTMCFVFCNVIYVLYCAVVFPTVLCSVLCTDNMTGIKCLVADDPPALGQYIQPSGCPVIQPSGSFYTSASVRGCRLKIITDQDPCKSDLRDILGKCFNSDNFVFSAD